MSTSLSSMSQARNKSFKLNSLWHCNGIVFEKHYARTKIQFVIEHSIVQTQLFSSISTIISPVKFDEITMMYV